MFGICYLANMFAILSVLTIGMILVAVKTRKQKKIVEAMSKSLNQENENSNDIKD